MILFRLFTRCFGSYNHCRKNGFEHPGLVFPIVPGTIAMGVVKKSLHKSIASSF